MHYLKQFFGMLNMPLLVAFLMAALAAAYQLRNQHRVACRWFLAAAVLTYLASIRLVGDALLGPLEQRYPSITDERAPPPVGYVVVLGSDYHPRAGISVIAALDADGLVRIVEGIRLVQRLAAAHLVVSGGAGPGEAAPALGYAELARQSGVPEASIEVSDGALDTSGEARAVAKLLGTAPFILVTSAYHMPRAMQLMERAALRPIPAPVGQRARASRSNRIGLLIPGSSGLWETEHALHEYLGLLAIKMGLD
jgi:uncharacterized SAM-binding protein YcdF (DUF218 family)